MTDIGRLNFVCIDDSEFSENGLNWYLDNHHRDEDTVGLVHVHEIPKLSTFDLFGGNIAVVEAYHQKLQESIKKAHGMLWKRIVWWIYFDLLFHIIWKPVNWFQQQMNWLVYV